MINVNAKKERVWTKVSGDYIFGSVLVSGGKDEKGNYKANGFVNVRFSNECQDNIYDTFNGEIPQVIVCDMEGFMSWNEYETIKEDILVITKISNIAEYVKEEKPEAKKPSTRRGH